MRTVLRTILGGERATSPSSASSGDGSEVAKSEAAVSAAASSSPKVINNNKTHRVSVASGRSGRMFLRPPDENQLKIEKALAGSGESFHPAVPANKFTFDPHHDSGTTGDCWTITRTTVKIAHHHFARGGMRMCYRAAELVPSKNKRGAVDGIIPSVVKLFVKRSASGGEVVFHEALTQGVAQGYAEVFNRLVQKKGLPDSFKVSFLPVSVLHFPTIDRGTTYATIEPFLPGEYIKLNDNTGKKRSEGAELAQVFSYFTYIASGGSLVVCDIQGVGSTFTDPQIHSADGKLFGAGNLGSIGIKRFLNSLEPSELLDKLGFSLPNKATIFKETKESEKAPTIDASVAANSSNVAEFQIPSSLLQFKEDIASDRRMKEIEMSTLDKLEQNELENDLVEEDEIQQSAPFSLAHGESDPGVSASILDDI